MFCLKLYHVCVFYETESINRFFFIEMKVCRFRILYIIRFILFFMILYFVVLFKEDKEFSYNIL